MLYGFINTFNMKKIVKKGMLLAILQSLILIFYGNTIFSTLSFIQIFEFSFKFYLFLFFIFLTIEVPTNISKKLRRKSIGGLEMTKNFNPIYIFSILSIIGKKRISATILYDFLFYILIKFTQTESLKYLHLNLPFPNRTFLHKQVTQKDKSIDFTLNDALIVMAGERLSLFYSILSERQLKIESLTGGRRTNSTSSRIKNYFLIRSLLNEIYCHLHIIILIVNCVGEGVLFARHSKHLQFNTQKSSFRRFQEIMVIII